MKSAEIRKATTHDLRQYLESAQYPEPRAVSMIRCELSVRSIVNTSATDGCDSVAQLETDADLDAREKTAILDEAERRERDGYNRLTLLGKIRATRKRIQKTLASAI